LNFGCDVICLTEEGAKKASTLSIKKQGEKLPERGKYE
jgi:hypothetical protein